ncbi:MAG: transcriptional repressor [Acidobacteriota bacterium]
MSEGIAEPLKIFANYLKQNGLKMTRQRELVVRTFLREEGHLSADELFASARGSDHKLGFATVFRTLKALTECGLARATDLSDGRTRFERLYRRPHHHHIVCEECGRTIEFFSPAMEEIQKQIVDQYHFKPLRHRLQVYGICDDCQKKQSPAHEVVDSDLVFARDALKIAIETEKRGVGFYRAAAESATEPSTRSTFLSMLKEEQKHLRQLTGEWNRLIASNRSVLDAPVFLHFDFDALTRIFPSQDEAKHKLAQNLNQKDALEMAMKMEREAHNFFSQYAERFNDTKGKEIFLTFAEEELEHYDLMRRELDRLG